MTWVINKHKELVDLFPYSPINPKKKAAFTLAEVLITLGIIGIVAAMTLPSLIQNNKNIEVETRLKKVYSIMNQAILSSEVDNGAKEYWACTSSKNLMETYLLPYMREVVEKTFNGYGGGNIAVYLNDGSLLVSKTSNPCIYDFFFYPKSKNFDKASFTVQDDNMNWTTMRPDSGITFFHFVLVTNTMNYDTNYYKFNYGKGFEPYKLNMGANTIQATKTGDGPCTKNSSSRAYCTALIQLNGWKIPKDYPVKVK